MCFLDINKAFDQYIILNHKQTIIFFKLPIKTCLENFQTGLSVCGRACVCKKKCLCVCMYPYVNSLSCILDSAAARKPPAIRWQVDIVYHIICFQYDSQLDYFPLVLEPLVSNNEKLCIELKRIIFH